MALDVHSLTRIVLKVPGARTALKWVTSRWGEGRVYAIRSGPMKGLRWRRENRFPYWYHTGRYEPEISALIAVKLRPGDVYWDLGAHAGYHTLQGARAVGPSGRVLAVEPDPSVCRSLREQLATNGLTNVTVVEAAVSDEAGSTRLVVRAADDTRGSALDSVHNPAIRNSRGLKLEVSSTTLDALAARFPSPHLLKMDIEGSEAAALRAGGQLWEGSRRPWRILLSYHGDESRAFCQRFLLARGYALEVNEGLGSTFLATDRASRLTPPGKDQADGP